MKKPWCYLLLAILTSLSSMAQSEDYKLATKVSKSGDTVEVKAHGYTKLNLLTIDVNKKGDIVLKGSFSIEGGTANIVMWSEVEGSSYFSKVPSLQEFGSSDYTEVSIPFSSPEQPITKVILDVELPSGGVLKIKNIELSGG